jgi:hypothetical protein
MDFSQAVLWFILLLPIFQVGNNCPTIPHVKDIIWQEINKLIFIQATIGATLG